MSIKFTQEFVSNELSIENDRELQEVTEASNMYGRLPDTANISTHYTDGLLLEWVWTDLDDPMWIAHKVYGYRSYQ